MHYIPAFHSNTTLKSIVGKGRYVLYHGKLSVGENDEAARFLIDKVFSKISIPFYVAGYKPSAALKAIVEQYPHIQLFEHLSTEQIDELIQQAHINVLPTFQATGIKLKLINVLFQGRFVIANDMMVKNTGLEDLCKQANSSEEFIQEIERLMEKTFTQQDIDQRANYLNSLFSNSQNVKVLLGLLY